MSLSLANKVAIVTGASRGIGEGIALELAKRGAKVVITYTSPSSEAGVNDLVSRIQSLNHIIDDETAAIGIRADLSTLEAPKTIVDATLKAFGPHIDILVNNAGMEKVVAFSDVTPEDFASVFNLNVRGTFFMSQAVLPYLRAPGRIINITSMAARYGFAQLSTYCASKAAVEGITRSLAKEIGVQGHTVNAVEPGPVDTEMIKKIPKEIVEMQMRETPVENRMATVHDIADCCLVGGGAE